jgi:hypothetical protein
LERPQAAKSSAEAEKAGDVSRAVVAHSAWCVGAQMIQARGMLGRSDGCFAVSEPDLGAVLGRSGPGHLLIAAKL